MLYKCIQLGTIITNFEKYNTEGTVGSATRTLQGLFDLSGNLLRFADELSCHMIRDQYVFECGMIIYLMIKERDLDFSYPRCIPEFFYRVRTRHERAEYLQAEHSSQLSETELLKNNEVAVYNLIILTV
jgi:hypothetical protein